MVAFPKSRGAIKRRFPELLHEAMQDSGVTLQTLAERVSLPEKDLRRRIEAGKVPWLKIALIARQMPGSVLSKSVAQLSGRKMKKIVEASEFKLRFPKLLREARANSEMTLRELARRSAIDATYLSRLERGLVPPPSVAKVAAIVRELPGTEFAHLFSIREDEKLKMALLNSTTELLELLGVAVPRTFEASWLSEIKHRLQKGVMMIEVSERTLRSEK
jgi:transcriptional regulator with XRE-family HTH domain